MRGGKINQGRLVARRRRRIFYICLYTASAAGLLVSALSYISGLQALSIAEVVVSGSNRLASSIIQSVALRDMSGTYAGFFSRANVLLYPRDQIRTDLLALPLIKTVSVGRSSMHVLALAVTERQTVALWCAGTTSDCYAVDENGFIFDNKNGADSGFMYENDMEGSPIGQNVLAQDRFKKVQFFMTELAKLTVDPRTVMLTASSTYMTIVLGGGGKLVVNSADDLSTVLGNISAITSDKSVAPSLPAFLAKLDYMKLDVGNKVVFKLR